MTVKKILVAVDRSPEAVHGAILAHELFGDDAEYTVVSVARGDAAAVRDRTNGLPTTIPFDMVTAIERGEASELAASVAREVLGPTASALGLAAPRPAKMICRIARDIGADYIVIGAPTRTLLNRLLTRSVAKHLIHNAPCPVVIARGSADGDGG